MLFFFFFGGYSDMQFTVRERTQWLAAWIKGTQLCASQIHHRIQQCTDFIIVSFSLQFCSDLCLDRMKFEKCILFPSKGIKYLLKTLKQVPFHTYIVSGFRMVMLKKKQNTNAFCFTEIDDIEASKLLQNRSSGKCWFKHGQGWIQGLYFCRLLPMCIVDRHMGVNIAVCKAGLAPFGCGSHTVSHCTFVYCKTEF